MNWTTLLIILYQRDGSSRKIDPVSEELNELLSSDEPTIDYRNGKYTIKFCPREQVDIADCFPFRDLEWEVSIHNASSWIEDFYYRYIVSFTAAPKLLEDIANLTQLTRSFSPIYPQDPNIFKQSFTIPLVRQRDSHLLHTTSLELLPTRSAPTSLELLPNELKCLILSFAQPEQGHVLDILLKPDQDYLIQEAENAGLNRECLEWELKRREEESKRVEYVKPLLDRLLKLNRFKLSHYYPDYQYDIRSSTQLDVKELLAEVGQHRKSISEVEEDVYVYKGIIVNEPRTSRLIADLNTAAQLLSEGYSSPCACTSELFLDHDTLTIHV